jgi:uncharacterized membrane protein YgcG
VELPIDEASAVVHLPAGAGDRVGVLEGYTGASGSRARDLHTERRADAAVFTTTGPLSRRDGLTIVLGWPKGFVRAPGAEALRAAFWRDNGVLVGAAFGVLALLLYSFAAWWRVGRDPPAGPLVVAAEPPEELSPAALRYVMRMGVDDTTFAAALISLADKRRVSIERDGDGKYTLRRRGGDTAPLPAEERAIVDKIFQEGDEIRVASANASTIGAAQRAMGKALAATYRGRYFKRNGRVMAPGLLLSVGVLIALVFSVRDGARSECAFFTVWVVFWSFAVYGLGRVVIDAWRKAAASGYRAGLTAGALFITLFATPFAAADVGVAIGYGFVASGMTALLFALTLVVDGLLMYLLPSPTLLGRRVLDGVAGYKAFLGGDGPERRAASQAPEFGYAVALGAVDAWTRGLLQATVTGSPSPMWNDPSWSGTSYGDFAGSFSSAVSSASSSGSGGGSSGGGGGGGGGGGW